MNWKEAILFLFKVLSRHSLEVLRKATKICQYSRSPGQDLKMGPPWTGLVTVGSSADLGIEPCLGF
jgi:hypothetical protein